MNSFSGLFFIAAFLSFTKPADQVKMSDGSTEIIITGTVHTETASFNSDTLLQLIIKVKPDLILVETDSSYFTPDLELNEDIKNEFPETRAITEYKKNHKVKLHPYDINGRDVFINDFDRISLRNEIIYRINNLRKNRFSSDTSAVWVNYESLIRLAYKMSDTNLAYINSDEGSFKIDSINTFTYEGIGKLLKEVHELNGYIDFWKKEIDFWNRRNESMLENIRIIIKENPGSRIFLMCGFAHKNYLLNGLLEYAEENEINIKVYGDYFKK